MNILTWLFKLPVLELYSLQFAKILDFQPFTIGQGYSLSKFSKNPKVPNHEILCVHHLNEKSEFSSQKLVTSVALRHFYFKPGGFTLFTILS